MASQARLGAALRQIDTLLLEESLRKQQILVLEAAAASAREWAYHDELTGLPNRRLLLLQFAQALSRAARRHGRVALIYLDLDGFKCINDVLGHSAGDDLLKQVSMRLVGCLRESDMACRIGGDEFVILLPELEGAEAAVTTAEKIRAQLALPYLIGNSGISITTSIGVAMYPDDGAGYSQLIERADVAMYRNKARLPAPPNVVDAGSDGHALAVGHGSSHG